jgi:hypothetical protein
MMPMFTSEAQRAPTARGASAAAQYVDAESKPAANRASTLMGKVQEGAGNYQGTRVNNNR